MLSAILILAVAAGILSGTLIAHQRLTTFIGMALAIFESGWLLLTLIDRTALASSATPTVFLFGSVVILILALLTLPRWSWPKIKLGHEFVVIAVFAVVALAALSIVTHNGFSDGAWVTHGFYNGDTATLAALVERSNLTSTLVQSNPFATGGALEYPTLIHAGLATLFFGVGMSSSWLALLPVVTLFQLIATIPLFFLLWDTVAPTPAQRWQRWFGLSSRKTVLIGQASITLLVLTLSWDMYVYPQSHFFITNLFLLGTALLLSAARVTGRRQIGLVGAAFAIALVLLFANAVTGTAALVIAMVFGLFRAQDRGRHVAERAWYLITVPIWLLLFLQFTPGNGSLGIIPGFSYSAAFEMMRLSLILTTLGVALYWHLPRFSLLAGMVTALGALALVTFIFSSRDIVVENASRFLYHAIIVGLPLLLYPALRTILYVRRELFYTSHTLFEITIGWALAGILAILIVLPGLTSVASAHDNLMRKDRQVISAAELTALAWIERNTPPESIFLSSPEEPWAIPIFTGRAIVRANYWLSPSDGLLADVTAAFTGDAVSQGRVVTQADYVYLHRDQKNSWHILPPRPVYENEAVSIYQLR